MHKVFLLFLLLSTSNLFSFDVKKTSNDLSSMEKAIKRQMDRLFGIEKLPNNINYVSVKSCVKSKKL